jgi:hypothetical protein
MSISFHDGKDSLQFDINPICYIFLLQINLKFPMIIKSADLYYNDFRTQQIMPLILWEWKRWWSCELEWKEWTWNCSHWGGGLLSSKAYPNQQGIQVIWVVFCRRQNLAIFDSTNKKKWSKIYWLHFQFYNFTMKPYREFN